MCVQELSCWPCLRDDGVGMTGVPSVVPFLQVLYPWPWAITALKNLQPWCCSCPSWSHWQFQMTLFIVSLTLLHTCQCFPLIAKLQNLNSCWKAGPGATAPKEWELVKCPIWGERWSNFLQQVRKKWLLSSLRILQFISLYEDLDLCGDKQR